MKYFRFLIFILTIICQPTLLVADDVALAEIRSFDDLSKSVMEFYDIEKANQFSYPYFKKNKGYRIAVYLQNKPDDLLRLQKEFPEACNLLLLRFAPQIIYTKTADMLCCEAEKLLYENKYKNDNILKKYYIYRFIVNQGLGSVYTQDIIDLVENKIPVPGIKDVFAKSPAFIEKFEDFKIAVSNNVELFNDLQQINQDDIKDWKIYTLSYTLEKFNRCDKNKLKEIKHSGKDECLKEIKDCFDIKITKDDNAINIFLEDYVAILSSEKTVKKEKKINPVLFKMLFNLLVDRGGRYDFQAEKIIKNIVGYSSCRRINRSDWARFAPLKNENVEMSSYGVLSVQSVLVDNNGNIRYLFSFSNGKWPRHIADNYAEYPRPRMFYFAEVVYRDNKPVNLVSTEIYATDEIMDLVNRTIREKYPVDFNELGTLFDPIDPFGSSFDLSKFNFTEKINEYYDLSKDFPLPPNDDSKQEEINIAKPVTTWEIPVGVELIP